LVCAQRRGLVIRAGQAVHRFIGAYKDRCEPFTWTMNAGEILTEINGKPLQARDARLDPERHLS
jgi:hypothetical protein